MAAKARRTSWAAPKQTLSLGPAFDKGWGETIMEYMTCSGGKISASRCVETPSRHRRASSPSDEVAAGFLFENGPFGPSRETAMLRAGRPESLEGQTAVQGHGGRKEEPGEVF